MIFKKYIPCLYLTWILLLLVGMLQQGYGKGSISVVNGVTYQSQAGFSTNGFYALISLCWPHTFTTLPRMDVLIISSVALTNQALSNQSKTHNSFLGRFKYFTSWDDLPGIIRLTDAEGHAVSPTERFRATAARFPQTIRLNDAKGMPQQSDEPGTIGHLRIPDPIMDATNQQPLVALQDMFVVSKPGTYELSIYPKIYKRSDADTNLLERMDLPPVVIKFQYDGNRTGKN
jgi:hypothetical protein